MKSQETVSVSHEYGINYRIDLVLVDAQTCKARCVLDTKYKKPDVPSQGDINQIVAYAETMQCSEAILIYPTSQVPEIVLHYPTKEVRTLVFDISKELQNSGEIFARKLLSYLEVF